MTPGEGERARVFAALGLGAELGARLAREVDGALAAAGLGGHEVRRPRPEGLHLTLFFVGDVERARAEELCAALREGLAGAPAPRLELAQGGGFPNARRARVLWIGVRERAGSEGRLAALAERTRTALARAGVAAAAERGRAFRPHVTVGRPRGRGALELPRTFVELDVALPWRPGEAVLFESCRGEGPPVYDPLGRVPLEES